MRRNQTQHWWKKNGAPLLFRGWGVARRSPTAVVQVLTDHRSDRCRRLPDPNDWEVGREQSTTTGADQLSTDLKPVDQRPCSARFPEIGSIFAQGENNERKEAKVP